MTNTFRPNLNTTANQTAFVRDLESRFSDSKELLSNENVILIPSFVDVHVHLREPGFFYKETIKSGTTAAAKAGYSHVFSMPNLKPVPDDLENLKVQMDIIEKDAVIEVIPYGSLTVGERGEELADMEAMAPYVCGFSDDGVGLNDMDLMARAMEIAKKHGKLIVAHCEDMELRNGGYIHDGVYAKAHGHKGKIGRASCRERVCLRV